MQVNPSDLRAKLLAQRASRQARQKLELDFQEKAKRAVRNMVLIGYSYDNILDMCCGKVSPVVLSQIFKSVRLIRRHKSASERNLEVFGAPRWFEDKRNYVIEISSDSEEDMSVEAADNTESSSSTTTTASNEIPVEALVTEVSVEAPTEAHTEAEVALENNLGADLEAASEVTSDVTSQAKLEASEAFTEAIAEATAEAPEAGTEMEVEESDIKMEDDTPVTNESTDMVVESTPVEPASVEPTPTEPTPVEPTPTEPTPVEPTPVEPAPVEPTPVEPTPIELTPVERRAELFFKEAEREQDSLMEPSWASEEATSAETTENVEALHSEDEEAPASERPVSDEKMENAGENAGDVHEKHDESESAEAAELKNTLAINEEIERVRSQIKEIERLKIERENIKLVEAEANRKSMALRDIAVKRSLLNQSRVQQLESLKKSNDKIARLKRSLMRQENEVLLAKQELLRITSQDEELSAREEQLRHELSRPKVSITVNSEEVETEEPKVSAENEAPSKPKRHIPTVLDSPLLAMSSFRMCPNYGPSFWFNTAFNGRFVPDLKNRTLCPAMLRKDKTICDNNECPHVHFSDFDVPSEEVCKYMASRDIRNPDHLRGLKKQIETYLKGDSASAAQVAAVIIGYNKIERPSQVLDWDTWGLKSTI